LEWVLAWRRGKRERGRERKGERKTKQNRFIGSAQAAQTHWCIVSPWRNQLLQATVFETTNLPTASQD